MPAPYSGRLIDYLGSGLHSARPASPNIFPGTVGLYWSTDTSELSAWDGSSWAVVTVSGSGVLSLNSLTGALSISAGTGIGVTASGSTVTITNTGGGTVALPWIDVTQSPYNADKTGATDATSAIQAAIDAAGTAGGGVIFFPIGIYLIAGALQDTSRSNSQLVLPKVSTASTQFPIVFLGQTPPPQDFSVGASMPFPSGCSVLKSNLSSGTGALLGVWGPSGSALDFSNIQFQCINILFETVPNPTISALDGSHIACIDINNVVACTGSYGVPSVTYPTTTTSYGIRLPKNGNGAFTRVDRTAVIGFYTGYQLAEHTTADQINAWACARAFEHITADHSSRIFRAQSIHCTKGFVPSGVHYLDVAQFNIEHASSGTWNPSYDIDDTSNYMHGSVSWHVVLAGVGADDTFTTNGALNVRLDEVGVAYPNITSSTAYTFIRNDCSRGVSFSASSAVTATINAGLAEVGSILPILQFGTGQITLSAGSGVTLVTPSTLKTRAQYSTLFAWHVSLNTWAIGGDMA